jgi:hypothetical protein
MDAVKVAGAEILKLCTQSGEMEAVLMTASI